MGDELRYRIRVFDSGTLQVPQVSESCQNQNPTMDRSLTVRIECRFRANRHPKISALRNTGDGLHCKRRVSNGSGMPHMCEASESPFQNQTNLVIRIGATL